MNTAIAALKKIGFVLDITRTFLVRKVDTAVGEKEVTCYFAGDTFYFNYSSEGRNVLEMYHWNINNQELNFQYKTVDDLLLHVMNAVDETYARELYLNR